MQKHKLEHKNTEKVDLDKVETDSSAYSKVDSSELNQDSVEKYAEAVAISEKADIYLFNGLVSLPSFLETIKAVSGDKNTDKCILMITTYGGDADFAYKIARWFQRFYSEFTVYPTSVCASAGTLIAIGATKLIMSPFSELGPLDAQLKIKDELGERKSGMVTKSALSTLEQSAFDFWQYFMQQIKIRSFGNITFETCSNIATSICSTVFAEMYRQIDPDILGQNERDLAIAYEYGIRLANYGKRNITNKSIDKLVKDYPSHNFVIDAEETETLFKDISVPSEDLMNLTLSLGELALVTNDQRDDVLIKQLATYKPVNNESEINENQQTNSRKKSK